MPVKQGATIIPLVKAGNFQLVKNENQISCIMFFTYFQTA